MFAPLASCLRYLRRPKSEEGEGGLCRSELRRWPPASGVCVGQKGEEGEGGFSSEKRERQRLSIFWNDVRFSVLICGCKSTANNCTGAIKFKNQNYVPNTIFFF